jgi:hypothetical protein
MLARDCGRMTEKNASIISKPISLLIQSFLPMQGRDGYAKPF